MKVITIKLFVKDKRSVYRIAKKIAKCLGVLIGPPINNDGEKEFVDVKEVQCFIGKTEQVNVSSIPDEADPLLMDCTNLSKKQLKERQERVYQWFDKRLRKLEEK